jgi:hypothetical protein
LLTEEIPKVVNDFRLAARNAIRAGTSLSKQEKKPPVDERRVLVTVNGKAVLAHLVDRILGLYSFSSNGEI